jgi:hypothetical protein
MLEQILRWESRAKFENIVRESWEKYGNESWGLRAYEKKLYFWNIVRGTREKLGDENWALRAYEKNTKMSCEAVEIIQIYKICLEKLEKDLKVRIDS